VYQVTVIFTALPADQVASKCANSADCADYALSITVSIPGVGDQTYQANGAANGSEHPLGSASDPLHPLWTDCYTSNGPSRCRSIPVFVDVTAFTANSPLTVTLTSQAPSSNPTYKPLWMNVHFLGNSHSELTQAPWGFRPRASQDAAADCDNNSSQCWVYPIGTIKGINAYLHSQSGLTMPSKIKMWLEPPAYMSGKWLQGVSTNFGNDTVNDPDYVFEQSENPGLLVSSDGLSITTTDAPNYFNDSLYAAVTSRDYGGAANLRMQIMLGTTDNGPGFGEWRDVDELWGVLPGGTTSGKVPPPSTGSPYAKCGAGVFAGIPVDYNCNGIADSWEGQYIPTFNSTMLRCKSNWVPITAFDGTEDFEPGQNVDGTPACVGGEGLSVRDEYRGFHSLVKPAGAQNWTVTWTSTDPVSSQDVFYMADWNWPAVPATPMTHASASRPLVDSINELLIARIPGLTFHRLTDPYAGLKDPVSFRRDKLNKNSVAGGPVFVIEFNNADIQVQNTSNQVDAGTLGVSTLYNDGSAPVDIYPSRIARESANTGFPVSLQQDITAAHEAGHKLQLLHPIRSVNRVPYDVTQLGNLTLAQFMLDPTPNTIHIGMAQYGYSFPDLSPTARNPFVLAVTGDDLLGYTLAANCSPRPCREPETYRLPPAYDADIVNVFRLQLTSPVTASSLTVSTLGGTIMDWKTRLARQDLSSWRFTSDQLSIVCTQTGIGDCRNPF
jgi:hypothetical protein